MTHPTTYACAASLCGIGGWLFVCAQYLLPQHGLSRLVLAASRVRSAWFKNLLTRAFLSLYSINLAEAELSDPYGYGSFNEFFTRALKVGARPIVADPAAIASPVDGTLSECGRIDGELLLQAKGRRYLLSDLLAAQPWTQRFVGGSFATIYLAPQDYHRVHMPLTGRLLDTVYVPGRRFSVNSATARHVPQLFARNERILTLFDMGAGRFALLMVGALNVGSMSTVWAADITPADRHRRVVTRLPAPALELARGAELGRFNLGSTVILLFEPNRARWDPDLRQGSKLKLGSAIGSIL